MNKAQNLNATTWHQPAVIGWFACALACAVRGGTWVALRGRHNSYAANLPIMDSTYVERDKT